MRNTIIAASVLLLFGACRGEKVPRDYQNAPPAMRHPPTSSAQTPTANGMRGPAPEPSKGAEGANITQKPASGTAANEKLGNQAPTTTTHT
ncbi:MAG: hypothetical protein QOF71_2471 [Candidatus Eremiobacteraeota bacterium]|jgi:hypothetical protein|nr:hypothetical protein [Candidatus Eremiobacteraeota bacterium]